ncbi:hypothetical protein CLU79DRAFT_832560 [Phycomyces nitens]|nr:hypothetical protein CLU79DRAFT_832560 [Phycomyces nitens]
MTSYSYFEGYNHKRAHTPNNGWDSADNERKRCVTDSVINDMAAMSLDNTTAGKFGLSYIMVLNAEPTACEMDQQANYVISIPDMDEYLSQQDVLDDENDITIDLDDKALVEANVNGSLLLMEMRPGEKKLRIPEFVLNPPTEFEEGHATVAYKYYLEGLEPLSNGVQEHHSPSQEIFEEPADSHMDID